MNNKFIVVVPVYNAEKYIERCLESILCQDYSNYDLIVVDDCSTDNTYNIIKDVHDKCTHKFTIHRNSNRTGSALSNMIMSINLLSCSGEDIIITIDGDDFLSDSHVFFYLDEIYQDINIYMTYGQFIPLSGSYGKFCKPIPNTQEYRKSGLWFASHLRTFKNKLWYKINDIDLRDIDGEYFKVAGDASYMYPLIEMCGGKHCKFIDKVLYIYNDLNPNNDMKINVKEQLKVAADIRNKSIYEEIKGEL